MSLKGQLYYKTKITLQIQCSTIVLQYSYTWKSDKIKITIQNYHYLYMPVTITTKTNIDNYNIYTKLILTNNCIPETKVHYNLCTENTACIWTSNDVYHHFNNIKFTNFCKHTVSLVLVKLTPVHNTVFNWHKTSVFIQ